MSVKSLLFWGLVERWATTTANASSIAHIYFFFSFRSSKEVLSSPRDVKPDSPWQRNTENTGGWGELEVPKKVKKMHKVP